MSGMAPAQRGAEGMARRRQLGRDPSRTDQGGHVDQARRPAWQGESVGAARTWARQGAASRLGRGTARLGRAGRQGAG